MEELTKYSKKIIHLKFYKKFGIDGVTGVLYFSSDGLTIDNGSDFNFYEGYTQNYNSLELIKYNNDFIPYHNVIEIREYFKNGECVEEYLKRLWSGRYNRVMERMNQELPPFFMLCPLQKEPEDHTGMIYNPYSDRWSFV
jgi:hypothetical protein